MRLNDYTPKDFVVLMIYVVVFTACFFLMFLGVLRVFEVNDYFGSEQYKIVKVYCEPRGFFGWGYDCDVIRYNKDQGNIPQDYRDPNDFVVDFPFNLSQSSHGRSIS